MPLYSILLFTITLIPGLTDLAMTPEFRMNYHHLSQIDIGVICLGAARIIIGILLPKKDRFFDRIKKIIYMVLPYLKENPLFWLATGIAAFFIPYNFFKRMLLMFRCNSLYK